MQERDTRSWRAVGHLVGLLLVGYYLPVTLVLIGVIPFEFRFQLLVMMTLGMAAYAAVRRRGARALGLRVDNLGPSLMMNLTLAVVLVGLMLVAYWAGLIRKPTVPDWRLFYVFYVFVSSPCQEFLYRSVLFAELQAAGVTKASWQIAVTALTYCFLHVIYRDAITLGVTLAMGVVWGIIYRRAPSLWGVAVSHAVLGVTSIAVGLI